MWFNCRNVRGITFDLPLYHNDVISSANLCNQGADVSPWAKSKEWSGGLNNISGEEQSCWTDMLKQHRSLALDPGHPAGPSMHYERSLSSVMSGSFAMRSP